MRLIHWPMPPEVYAFRDKVEALEPGKVGGGYGLNYVAPGLSHPLIVDENGKVIGNIAYNGKVFPGKPEDWKSGEKPLYDPSGAERLNHPSQPFSSRKATLPRGGHCRRAGEAREKSPAGMRGQLEPETPKLMRTRKPRAKVEALAVAHHVKPTDQKIGELRKSTNSANHKPGRGTPTKSMTRLWPFVIPG